jgi:predicted AAA+ superfamily ATPase
MVLKSEIEKAFQLQNHKLRLNTNDIDRVKNKDLQSKSNLVQVISGVRRSGKSTLLRHEMRNYKKIAYLNFEDPRLFNFEIQDFVKLDEILPKDTEAYFFDEIQNVDKWEIYIRQLHDDGKKVFVTGSNASLLSKDLGTRLTGRYLNCELFPFSYREFLEFERKDANETSFQKYLSMGGFPEFLKIKSTELLQNLFKDIVLRDIAIRYSVRNTKTLVDIALYMLSNIGKEISYTKIKNLFQVGSTHSVIDYLNWMEDAYLLFFVHKFSWSTKSIAISPKKVYAIDNGLIDANSLSFSEDKGRRLENAVFIYLRNLGKKIFYFKEKNECDFVIFEKNKCTDLIQVCYDVNLDNQHREINGLVEAMKYFNLQKGTIITFKQTDRIIVDDKEIHLVPAYIYFTRHFD